MRLRWTIPAIRDVEAIGDHIAGDDPGAAADVVARIFGQTDHLIDHPRLGRTGRVEGTRELIVTGTPFIVAYRVRDDELDVLAVIHGARRWPDAFR